MKILYLALVELDVYNAPRTHTIEVCENFKKLGQEIILLAPRPTKKKQDFSFNVVSLPFFGFGFVREFFYNIILCFYLIFYILKFKPDIIYERMLNNPLCLIISKIFRKKHFLEVNGPPFEENALLQNFFTKIEIEKTDGIISSSPKLENLISNKVRISKDKIKVVSDSINPDFFYPQDKLKCRKEIELDKNYFYLGYTGGVYWAYDFDFIFRVMNKIKDEIKDIKLLIVGPNIKENHPENVIFVKEVKYDKVPLYINSFDACLWPRSKRGLEEWGILSTKLFEYIACGKVVLAPKIQDEEVPDLFKNFIVFYKYGDEDDFIDKLKELYYNREKLNRTKKEVENFIKEYSWEETTKKIIEFIKRNRR